MANMEYNLLPAQALVVDPALGWEEGGIFALWNPEGCGNGGDPGKEGGTSQGRIGNGGDPGKEGGTSQGRIGMGQVWIPT